MVWVLGMTTAATSVSAVMSTSVVPAAIVCAATVRRALSAIVRNSLSCAYRGVVLLDLARIRLCSAAHGCVLHP